MSDEADVGPSNVSFGPILAYGHVLDVQVKILAQNCLQAIGLERVEVQSFFVARLDFPDDRPQCFIVDDLVPHGLKDVLRTALLDRWSAEYAAHPSHNMMYGDDYATREKPGRIRGDAMSAAIRKGLVTADAEDAHRTFVGKHQVVLTEIASYFLKLHVTPVIRVPDHCFHPNYELTGPVRFGEHFAEQALSLTEQVLLCVLKEATDALDGREPGQSLKSRMRSADEVVRTAADMYCYTPTVAVGSPEPWGLFDSLNRLSGTFYEGDAPEGTILLTPVDDQHVQFFARFRVPIDISSTRWARKALQMASGAMSLVCSGREIYGLGKRSASDSEKEDTFVVRFLGHYRWELVCNAKQLQRTPVMLSPC